MKNFKTFILTSILVSALFLASAPFFAIAAGLLPCGTSEHPNTPCSVACFYVLISNIINFLLFYISLPLSATAFMVAGIYLVMGGSEKAITTGKEIFKATLIGIFIAFGAWVLIDFILGNLLQSGYLPWNKFPNGDCTPNPTTYNFSNNDEFFHNIGYNMAIGAVDFE